MNKDKQDEKNKNVMRRCLDRKFKAINKFKQLLEHPPQGWVKTIRQALGLNTIQLAIKMGITQPRVTFIEKHEESLSIAKLREAAAALGCRLFYVLVPEEELEFTVKKMAYERNKKLVKSISHHMALEAQEVASQNLLEDLEE